MEIVGLMNAAEMVSRRNVNENVVAVGILWDSFESKLTVKYYLDHEPTDDDVELCELSLTELLSEFSDIVIAETACIKADGKAVSGVAGETLVYAR